MCERRECVGEERCESGERGCEREGVRERRRECEREERV